MPPTHASPRSDNGNGRSKNSSNNGSNSSASSVHLRYRVLRRIWFVAFVIGIFGNLWLNISLDSKQHYISTGKWLLSEFKQQRNTSLSSNQAIAQRARPASVSGNSLQSPPQDTAHASLGSANTDNHEGFSICLLIKDDNGLLNEWIAYHYHTIQLRTLIVAIDPSSETSPSPILQNWKEAFPNLHIEEWSDDRYMPDFFLNGQYDMVPRMIKWGDTGKKWMPSTNTNSTGTGSSQQQGDAQHEDASKLEQETFQHVNNHRYRQSLFLRECMHTLQEQNKTWMTHIDTDEYIVINPNLRKEGLAGNVTVPTKLCSSTIYKFLQDVVALNGVVVNWPCISLPRLLFGSIIDKEEGRRRRSVMMSMFNLSKFETYSWKYHTSYNNDKLNRSPKVILDVSGFPKRNTSQYAIRKVFSIHRPSIELCRKQGQMDFYNGRKYPISVNHYVGTYERYLSRQDPRRNINAYNAKALVKDGKDDNWIDGWLDSFINEHGIDKVSRVLSNYVITPHTDKQMTDKTNQATKNQPEELGLSLPLQQDSFSACLLIRDDNDILNEWIAYHYHTIKLRTLIVAIDPSSTTSPSSILNKWNTSTGLTIYEWSDGDYMPDFFLQKRYDLVPDMIGSTNRTAQNDNGEEEEGGDWDNHEIDDTMDEEWKLQVNCHRFRQATFLQTCVRQLWEQKKTWFMHIDSDEYLVLHPLVRQQDSWRKVPISQSTKNLGPSSILKFIKDSSVAFPKAVNYPCISMPRLLYGSVEDNEIAADTEPKLLPVGLNVSHFETIRWKYHSNYDEDAKLNGRPKVIMDLSGIPPKANFLRDRVYSIHRPGLFLCRNMAGVNFEEKWKFPITVNHYLGSWARYNSRNDPRRSRATYEAKSNLRAGKDDDWIDHWLTSFVSTHGIDSAARLLDLDEATVAHLSDLHMDVADEHGSSKDNMNFPSEPLMLTRARQAAAVRAFDESGRDSFSACMLIKDDNDILNEWLAYHYHTIGLRYVIAALDSTSKTSPNEIFDKWRKIGMEIEVWKDEMFMPDMFFKKQYHLMPRLVKIKRNKHKWIDKMDTKEDEVKLALAINDHRFRQITFLSNCTRALRAKKRTWMVHIDTDEYIVINPMLRRLGTYGDDLAVPTQNEASVVPRLLNQMIKPYGDLVNYPCISLPRLLYGSVEDKEIEGFREIPEQFNVSRFESLRWKYHAGFNDTDRNKQPKVILDVSAIPEDDKMLTDGRVFSIHRPSQTLCRNLGQMGFERIQLYPFSVNHYLGTFERFGARDDPRRNRRLYEQKANVTEGKDDGWMDSWLKGFVSEQGFDIASDLLGDYLLSN